jgi:hypothetical protein
MDETLNWIERTALSISETMPITYAEARSLLLFAGDEQLVRDALMAARGWGWSHGRQPNAVDQAHNIISFVLSRRNQKLATAAVSDALLKTASNPK